MQAPERMGPFRFRGSSRSPLIALLIGWPRTWFQVDVDEPWEITGTSWRNKRLSDRLWAELSRVGVSKRDGHSSFVEVAGEFRTGFYFSWWSSAFLIGIIDHTSRRVFSFTGTQLHEDDTWTGMPERAFGLFASLPRSAGQDAFWRTFSADAGYAKEPRPTKEPRASDP